MEKGSGNFAWGTVQAQEGRDSKRVSEVILTDPQGRVMVVLPCYTLAVAEASNVALGAANGQSDFGQAQAIIGQEIRLADDIGYGSYCFTQNCQILEAAAHPGPQS